MTLILTDLPHTHVHALPQQKANLQKEVTQIQTTYLFCIPDVVLCYNEVQVE